MHTFTSSPENVSQRQQLVGLVWLILPLVLTFALGLWAETSRPWISPSDLDETLMPLPSLLERCVLAIFCPGMVFTVPMFACGLALRVRRIAIDTLIFCMIALFIYGLLLLARFGYVWPLAGISVPFGAFGVCVPTGIFAGLLLLLRHENSVAQSLVWLGALLPVAPVWLWMALDIL